MSDNKFSENMVVCAVGNLSPGNISDSCEICSHNKFSFPGVLIAGVTKDAVMLLSEKVEIVPEGTKAKVAELEASNAELLELVCDIDEELSLAQADAIETGNMTGSSLPANLIIRLRREINKAKGVQG